MLMQDVRRPGSTVDLLTYWLTYLLTPWCRVLLDKLTGLQLVKKFPAFHGTRTFITALTSVCHLSLSWASPIQSIYPHPTFWRSILILSTHLSLCVPSGLFPSSFPTRTPSNIKEYIWSFDNIWIIRNNTEIDKLIEDADIVRFIKA